MGSGRVAGSGPHPIPCACQKRNEPGAPNSGAWMVGLTRTPVVQRRIFLGPAPSAQRTVPDGVTRSFRGTGMAGSRCDVARTMAGRIKSKCAAGVARVPGRGPAPRAMTGPEEQVGENRQGRPQSLCCGWAVWASRWGARGRSRAGVAEAFVPAPKKSAWMLGRAVGGPRQCEAHLCAAHADESPTRVT